MFSSIFGIRPVNDAFTMLAGCSTSVFERIKYFSTDFYVVLY